MSQIKLTADSGGGTTSIKAPSSTTSNADVVLKLPVADGSANQVLKTDGSGQLSFTSNAGTTINNNADNRIITGSDTASTLEGEQYLTWNGSTLGLQKSGGGDVAVNIEVGNGISQSRLLFSDSTAVDGTVTYDHNDRKLFIGAGTSTPTDGDITIDSSGNVGIGTTSPAQLLHVNGQAKVGTLGVGQDAGSSTLAITGNAAINTTGNTAYSKFIIGGSGVTTGSAFTINNYGDAEGDYYHFGVNTTQNASGNNSKTNTAKRSAAVTLDGRIGRVVISTSQTSTSTIDEHFTFDRGGDFTLAGNVVVANGKGIDFGATADGYAGSVDEVLKDYEEGYFTPTLGGWSASGTGTYSTQNGRYTKIGQMVTVWFHVHITNLSNASGVFALENLPFSHSSSTYNGSTAVQMRYIDYNGDTVFGVFGNGYSSSLLFYAQNDNANHDWVGTDASCRVEGTVSYITES